MPENGITALVELCRNLVALDAHSNEVIFAHLSVQEYPERRQHDPTEAHPTAGERRLSRLRSTDAEHGDPFNPTSTFSSYSRRSWAGHFELAFSSNQCMRTGTRDALQNFLGTPTNPGWDYLQWLEEMKRYQENTTTSWSRLGFQFFKSQAELDLAW